MTFVMIIDITDIMQKAIYQGIDLELQMSQMHFA